MDWDKLKTFHAAAESGSLTAAAHRLSVSQSCVSRQIAALERDLNVRLFHRHARGLEPTEQGDLLFAATRDVASRLARAEAHVTDSRDTPSGELMITAPEAFGAVWLTPRIGQFLQEYPEIHLELDITDSQVELTAGRVAAALRMWRPTRSDLVQRRLSIMTQSLYASREYLAAHGPLESLQDFADHTLLVYGPSSAPEMRPFAWPRQGPLAASEARAKGHINSMIGLRDAVVAGVGVAILPDFLAEPIDDLRPAGPGFALPEFALHFVYAEDLRGSRRVAAFSEFLTRELAAWKAARTAAPALASA